MDSTFSDIARAMIRPGIFMLFGFVFLWVWGLDRTRSWILCVAVSSFMLAAAMVSHFLAWPGGPKPAAVFCGFLYTLSVLCACEGLLLRTGKRCGLYFDCTMLALVTGLLWIFTYASPSLWARIYIQNFGYGALLLFTSFRLAELRHGNATDRILFWILLGFSVQFFIFTSLTLGLSTPESGKAFVASPFWGGLQLSLTVFGSGLAFAVLIAAITDMMEDLRRERDSDPLTGALNRRGLAEQVRRQFRNPTSLASVIVCDIDHFKSINDTFGHDAGDAVLRAFGLLLNDIVRDNDIVARTGGEEFMILLRATVEDHAAEVADRIRHRFKTTVFEFEVGKLLATASFGVAEQQPEELIETTVKRADGRLYEAKNTGRNRVFASKDSDQIMISTRHKGTVHDTVSERQNPGTI